MISRELLVQRAKDIRDRIDPLTTQLTMKTTLITAALLGMATCAPAAAELNVKQMLIMNDRANKNNANTTESVLGESTTGKGARATLPSSRSTRLARLFARTG